MRLSNNFKREEFACKCGCGFDTVDVQLIKLLDQVRFYFAEPLIITSGARCAKRNRTEGGSETSQHKLGKAADVVVVGVKPYLVATYVERMHPDTYGVGRYEFFTHLDVREKKARWDTR